MAFFKIRWPGQQAAETKSAKVARAVRGETVEVMRRRARHRLMGAALLVFVGVVGFPLVFDTQPRPIPPALRRRLDLEQTQGLEVVRVEEGRPAAQAGLRQGDVIVAAGGRPIQRYTDLLAQLQGPAIGRLLPLVALRNGERRTFTLVPVEAS